MKRCAFLTMANMDEFECYDNLLYKPFESIGWEVTPVPWRSSTVNWDDFDVVIIRSPWDYQQAPVQFMSVLESINASAARLENSLDIVKWNIDKTYLKDLQQKNISIVPTSWHNKVEPGMFAPLFDNWHTFELIIKPVISANADDTFRIRQPVDDEQYAQLANIFDQRPFMIQPFMPGIIDEGEFSLFYFAGHYSHTILKIPGRGDFRVQEEHGGQLKTVEPEPELAAAGERTLQALPEIPLYARIDFVRYDECNFALMEVELIEPSLYFNMDPQSPERFTRHFELWMQDRL